MKSNMANGDRLIRIIFGFGLIVVAIDWNQSYASCALSVIGLVSLITGLTSRCPLYAIFKINTRNINDLNKPS